MISKAVFCLLLIFLTLSHIFSQTSGGFVPLSLTDLEKLISSNEKRVYPQQDMAIAGEIAEKGVNFSITEEIVLRLKDNGAGPKTMAAILAIRDIQRKRAEKQRFNKVRILVAEFSEQNQNNDGITDLVINQLKISTNKYPNIEILPRTAHITPQEGKSVAVNRGKLTEADIVVWGWYRKSSTKVIINSQVLVLSNLSTALLPNPELTLLEEIPDLNNFSAQLRLSKEVSLITLVSIGIINSDLGNYGDASRYFTDAISLATTVSRVVDISKLYIFRAISRLEGSCDYYDIDGSVLTDADHAIRLGLDSNDTAILRIQASGNIRRNPKKGLEFAVKYFQIAKLEKDKTISLFLLIALYEVLGDKPSSHQSAERLIDHLLVSPESFSNYLHLSLAYLVLKDSAKAAVYLEKARNSGENGHPEFYKVFSLQGLYYSLFGNQNLAIENFRKSIELRKGCVSNYLNLAYTYQEQEDFDSALNAFNQALEVNSDISEIYVAKGEIYEKRKDYEKALANYKKAVATDPDSVEASRAIASFYKSQNRTNEAIASFTRLLEIEKDDEEGLRSRIELYITQNKFEAAIGDYRSLYDVLAKKARESETNKLALRIFFRLLTLELSKRDLSDLGIEFSDKYIRDFPKDSLGFEERADFLIEKDDVDEAINALSQLVRMDGNNPTHYKKRSSLWLKKKNLEKALEDIDQAIRLDKSDFNSRNQRVELYLEIDKVELAVEECIQIFSLVSQKLDNIDKLKTNSLFIELTLKLEQSANYSLGLKLSDNYIKYFPQESRAYEARASFLAHEGKIELAIEAITKAISLKSTEKSYFRTRSGLFRKMFDVGRELEDLNTLLSLDPTDLRALEQRAQCYIKLDKFVLAVNDYRNLIVQYAKNKSPYSISSVRVLLFELRALFEKRKEYELGIKLATDLIHLFPKEPSGFGLRAELLNDFGKHREALVDVEEAIKLEPRSPHHYALRSEIFEKTGDLKSAIESMEKAVELAKDDPIQGLYEGMLGRLKAKSQ